LPTSESRSKIIETFEIWCWRRAKKLIIFSCVGNEGVLHIVKEGVSSVPTVNRRKCNLIGHILLRNCRIENDIA
jgi:hypothetical protein